MTESNDVMRVRRLVTPIDKAVALMGRVYGFPAIMEELRRQDVVCDSTCEDSPHCRHCGPECR